MRFFLTFLAPLLDLPPLVTWWILFRKKKSLMLPEVSIFILAVATDLSMGVLLYLHQDNTGISKAFFLIENLIYFWLFARWTNTTRHVRFWGSLTLLHLANWSYLMYTDDKTHSAHPTFEIVNNLGLIVLVNILILKLIRMPDFKGSKDYRIWMLLSTLSFSATISILAAYMPRRIWIEAFGIEWSYNFLLRDLIILTGSLIDSYAFYLAARHTFAAQLNSSHKPLATHQHHL